MSTSEQTPHPLTVLRQTYKLGYQALAERSGMDRANIWNMERGNKTFTTRAAVQIETGLGMEPYSLVRWAEDLDDTVRERIERMRVYVSRLLFTVSGCFPTVRVPAVA